MASLATTSAKYKKRDKIYYRQDRQHTSRPGYIEVCTKEGGYSLRLEWNGTIVSQPKVSAADARTHFPEAVFDVTIPRNVRLSESPSFGKPIYLYDRASKGAKAYERLADHLARKHMKGPLK